MIPSPGPEEVAPVADRLERHVVELPGIDALRQSRLLEVLQRDA
jgi:hypothetical protein